MAEVAAGVSAVQAQFGQMEHGLVRAWIYVALMYALTVPWLLLKTWRILVDYKPPYHAVSVKIVLSVFLPVFLGVLASGPVLILILGREAIGRGHLAYLSMTNIVSLVPVGAMLFYAVVVSLWGGGLGLAKIWLARSGMNNTGNGK